MRTRKRKGASLPRLTVMAWSKRELASFVLAVEQLGHHVHALDELIERMKAKSGQKPLSLKATDAPSKCNGYSGRPAGSCQCADPTVICPVHPYRDEPGRTAADVKTTPTTLEKGVQP